MLTNGVEIENSIIFRTKFELKSNETSRKLNGVLRSKNGGWRFFFENRTTLKQFPALLGTV